MKHFFNETKGENWFTYEFLYKSMVERFDNNSHFVEVGTWKGMSACYMAVEIINSGKKIKFDCVDTWDYVPTSEEISADRFIDLYDVFIENISPVKDVIGIVKSLSWDGAAYYKDNSLDFVFIDAGHDYDSVSKDIKAWFPKLKSTGVIAGHDYHFNVGVFPAVNEFFAAKKINVKEPGGACWLVDLANL